MSFFGQSPFLLCQCGSDPELSGQPLFSQRSELQRGWTFLLLSLKWALKALLNSLQTLSSPQGFFQNVQNNHMEIPSSSGVSDSSPVAPPVPLLSPNTAGTFPSTAKGTWAHKKAAKSKLAKGHLRSLPASLGSSTQIETLEAVPGLPAPSHGSPSVLSVRGRENRNAPTVRGLMAWLLLDKPKSGAKAEPQSLG